DPLRVPCVPECIRVRGEVHRAVERMDQPHEQVHAIHIDAGHHGGISIVLRSRARSHSDVECGWRPCYVSSVILGLLISVSIEIRNPNSGVKPGMAKARSRNVGGAGAAKSGSDEEMLVRLFRVLTDEQFDYWIACLNRAVVSMGGEANSFT